MSQPVRSLRALNPPTRMSKPEFFDTPVVGRTMPSGIVLFPNPRAINVVDDVVAQASRAYDLGVRQVWLGQQHDHDAIALAALVARPYRGSASARL